MYMEFRYPLKDYFSALGWREGFFDLGVPLILVIGTNYAIVGGSTVPEESLKDLVTMMINVVTILIGFSITALAVLASGGSENIETLKQTLHKSKKIEGARATLYQLLVVQICFSLMAEILALLFGVAVLVFAKSEIVETKVNWLYLSSLYFFLHIVLLNIRSVTNFYFVMVRKG